VPVDLGTGQVSADRRIGRQRISERAACGARPVSRLLDEAVRLGMQQKLQRGREILSELLALGQKRGEVRRDLPALTLAFVFQQTFFGALMMWSFNPAIPLDERFDAAFPLLWSGMAAGHENQGKERLP